MVHNSNQDDEKMLERNKTPRETVEERKRQRDPRNFTGASNKDYKKFDGMDEFILTAIDGEEEYEQVRQTEGKESTDNC